MRVTGLTTAVPWCIATAVIALIGMAEASEIETRSTPMFPGARRFAHAVVLDSDSQQLLMYGGLAALDSTSDQFSRLDELWIFDLALNSWTQVPRTEPWPDPRNSHAMDYGSTGRAMFLFGGDGEHPCPPSLWSYSTTDRIWRPLGEASPKPVGRSWTSVTVDQRTGDPWVFFGSCAGEFAEGDNLRFHLDGEQWSKLIPPADGPWARAAHVSAYDSNTGRILLFGGFIPQVGLGPKQFVHWTGVWDFDPLLGIWGQLSSPDSSDEHFMRWAVGSYDLISDVLLVYGGIAGGRESKVSNDVWSFDMRSRQWRRLYGGDGEARMGRWAAAGAYCPCTGEQFISGGRISKTLSYASVSPDAFFIPIETHANFEWRGRQKSDILSRRRRWGVLTFPPKSDPPQGFEEGSMRLVDCSSGNTLQSVNDVSRIGGGRWKVGFEAPGSSECVALEKGHVVLTGRPVGSSVNFMANVPSDRRSARGGHELAPSATTNPIHEFALGAARPNPSSGAVNFSFTMATEGKVLIGVYDLAGRLVRTLINGNASAGPHELTWDASDDRGRRVGAGVYFYRMDAGAWRSQRKVVFLER